jgi:phospholipase C
MGREVTRRELLARGAAVTGVALAGRVPGARARMGMRSAAPRSLWDVEHVVIMMQENRSFDHIFGTLAGVRGFSDPAAISGADGRSVFDQELAGAAGSHVWPYRLGSAVSSSQCLFGPAGLVNQSWDQSHLAWDRGRLDKWTSGETAPWAMGYLSRQELPFYYALADQFAVCDGYHASVMGPTDPNRLMLFTGTIDPHGRGGGPVIDNSHESGLAWTTFPERLQAAGVSWRVYHETDDFTDNDLRFFTQYQRAPKSSPLYQNALQNRGPDAFADDAAAGRLPQVSWIVAPSLQSEHPGYGSIAAGENYVSRQLEAVMGNPKLWAKTVFLFCYDEHGGFFDHVPPPTPPPGTSDEFVAGLPVGLGFRVPMVICSPFTRGRKVCHQTFDHTSIIRLIERRFGVTEPNISTWRRRTCGDLTAAFDFAHPDYTIPELPATGPLVAAAQQDCRKPAPQLPPAASRRPGQESGRRMPVSFREPIPPLSVHVWPDQVRAGHPATLRFSVSDPAHKPVSGARISLSGRHARTNHRGVATIRLTLARGRHSYTAIVRAGGYLPTRALVQVR